jgi:hypothetical protein
MSPEAIKFRDCILRISDPVRLLTKAIPEACGVEIDRTRKLMNNVRACADELAAIAASYGEQAATAMRNSIGLGRSTENATITQVCQRWASCFSDSFVESLTDTTQKAFLTRLNHEYSNDGALLDSLGSLLVGRGLSRWDDSTILAFERSFQNHVRAVEDASLSSNCTEKSDGVTDLIYGRMQELYDRLKDQVGKDEAQAVLDAVVLGRDRSSLWFRSAK